MIESIMYMGIGFLLAALIGVAVMPLVHARAIRLTTRRLENTLPQSMEEIQAGKDLLRAEFAMSTRRLELITEELRGKMAGQLVELGKKGNTINRMKAERDALKANITALKIQIEALKQFQPAPRRRPAEGDIITVMRRWIPHRIHH